MTVDQEFRKLETLTKTKDYRLVTTQEQRSKVIERMAELSKLKLQEILQKSQHEDK